MTWRPIPKIPFNSRSYKKKSLAWPNLCHMKQKRKIFKIVIQVEFYFSDANICKDKFLLKHVKRNKEGYVSLKLISSFKRIKHLTKDWRQVRVNSCRWQLLKPSWLQVTRPQKAKNNSNIIILQNDVLKEATSSA